MLACCAMRHPVISRIQHVQSVGFRGEHTAPPAPTFAGGIRPPAGPRRIWPRRFLGCASGEKTRDFFADQQPPPPRDLVAGDSRLQSVAGRHGEVDILDPQRPVMSGTPVDHENGPAAAAGPPRHSRFVMRGLGLAVQLMTMSASVKAWSSWLSSTAVLDFRGQCLCPAQGAVAITIRLTPARRRAGRERIISRRRS